MALILTNNAVALLTTGIGVSDTVFTITGGKGALFPSTSLGDEFHVSLVDSSNNIEIVKVTNRTGDVFTVTRAQEGTTARAYSTGDRVALTMTAEAFNSKADKVTVAANIAAVQADADAAQAAANAAQSTANSAVSSINAHLASANAHGADEIDFSSTSGMSSTKVNTALDELNTEKLNIADKALQAEAEAGTDDAKYMTALKTKQAIDALGLAVAQAQAVGVGQTVQDVAADRSFNVVYTNDTGKPIFVSVAGQGSPNNGAIRAFVDGIQIAAQGVVSVASATMRATVSFLVPNGSTYEVENISGASKTIWVEWR